MIAALLVLAALWVATGLVAFVLLLLLAYGDERRIRRDTRRMWAQVEEMQR